MEPPPLPFSVPENVADQPMTSPSVHDSEPVDYKEAATMMQPSFSIPESVPEPAPAWNPPPTPQTDWSPPPAPVAEWTPPPAPDASWQNQEIGSNTPFQSPPRGVATQNNTLGLVSLILGILSFVCLGFLGSIPAIILGLMQRSKIKNNPAEYGGAGMAVAGIILGVLNVIVTIVILILYAGLIFANMR